MSGKENYNLLVVDDERSMREFLEILLIKEGYRVSLASSGEEACKKFEKERYDLVVTDIRMNDVDGIEVLKKAKEISPQTMVIIISAFATAETAVQAMKEGAYDYIPKPFKVNDFKRIVKDALLSRKRPSGDNQQGKKRPLHFGYLVGESPQMRKIYDLIERVAPTKTNILIFGESGTGKELVARAVHEQSPRRDKPFVVINCAGIPENLIESELFGYKKGAFTGAGRDKAGLFDVADGGTVFFDEVGELPLALQVKLLRVIQERTFTAVGGTEEKSVDVRFISATNKDLEKAVMKNQFREDLFFRLNVIQITMPPLRERSGDLPLLAQFFLEQYSRELNKDVKKISAFAMDILSEYSFPGNVRELENIVERSVALETSNIVLPESLKLGGSTTAPSTRAEESILAEGGVKKADHRDLTPEGIDLDQVLAEAERSYITKALEMTYGSQKKAAELLRITYKSLRHRIQKLRIK